MTKTLPHSSISSFNDLSAFFLQLLVELLQSGHLIDELLLDDVRYARLVDEVLLQLGRVVQPRSQRRGIGIAPLRMIVIEFTHLRDLDFVPSAMPTDPNISWKHVAPSSVL